MHQNPKLPSKTADGFVDRVPGFGMRVGAVLKTSELVTIVGISTELRAGLSLPDLSVLTRPRRSGRLFHAGLVTSSAVC